MSTDVGYCLHCMSVRNMRAPQKTNFPAAKIDESREAILYHCEPCGQFIKAEKTSRPYMHNSYRGRIVSELEQHKNGKNLALNFPCNQKQKKDLAL